jgi:hypothetical protein
MQGSIERIGSLFGCDLAMARRLLGAPHSGESRRRRTLRPWCGGSHLAVNPPLPTEELAAFKRSVAVLTELRRLLAQSAQTLAPGHEDLQRTRVAIAALEERTDDLARAALISWESRSV